MNALMWMVLAGCSGPYSAPMDADFSYYPADMQVLLTPNEPFDGFGVLKKLALQVVGPDHRNDAAGTSLPLSNVEVEIISSFDAAYLVPEGAVLTYTDFEEACGAGAGSEGCSAWFDTESQSYVMFAGIDSLSDLSGSSTPPGFGPTYMSGVTDERGILDFYLFVDALPEAGESFDIYMSIGATAATFMITNADDAEAEEGTDTGGDPVDPVDTGATSG